MAAVPINTNIASNRAQRQLANSTSALGKTFERLSSGLRINRASDDAAGMAIASNLDVDAHVFNQGIRNINDGISYLNIAEGATTAFKDVLIRIRELSTQSSNGTIADKQRAAMDSETQALVGEYNRILQTTSFNGRQIFGPNSDLSVQAGYGQSGTLIAPLNTIMTPDGTFQASQAFATGSAPYSVAIADLNGDGVKDLVTADSGSNTVSVLQGNGNGTFQARQVFATGTTPYAVAIADLNGDGIRDLVTTDYGSNTVSVFLGNGNSTFQARQAFVTGAAPIPVAIEDINGDGVKDLVIGTDTGTVSVLIGNGNGSFQAKQALTTAATVRSVAIADLNNDGIKDLVTGDYSEGTFSVFMGNGNGTFQASQTSAISSYGVAVDDFNGDGIKDLVTGGYITNTINVLRGNGDGTFQAGQAITTGGTPYTVAIADLNGDGVKDLVTSDYGSNTVSVLLGNGTSSNLSPISGISVATRASALSAQGTIDSYLLDVNTVAGIIGSSMSRFETAVQTLTVTSENYQAAKSRIVDVDVAEESANLVKNRILQQAGASILAQANQLPELALSLLK